MTDIVSPPTIDALPPAPQPTDTPSEFDSKAFALLAAQVAMVGDFNSAAAATQQNATAANERAVAAASSASAANGSASTASTHAGVASGAATTATDKAAEATASALSASKLNLGNKASPPTTDNQGSAILAGATYYDTTLGRWRVWTGAAWGDGVSVGSGVVAAQINAATVKTPPADADELGITDSAASWGLKKLTFANLKAWISSLGGAGISNTPSGNISATNVQAAINEIDSEKVSKTGDTMTGQLLSKKSFGDGASSSNFVAEAEGTAQGQAAGYSFRPTFTGTADNGPRRAADIWASYSGEWGTERLSLGVGVGVSNDGLNRTIERLAITGEGNVLVTGGGLLGYGVGSGGTATQPANKASNVVLNKPFGFITMNPYAIGPGTRVWFTLNNTSIGASDCIYLWIQDPVSAQSYSVSTDGVSLNAARVVLHNYTGAHLSDAVVIGFVVIKGSAS